MRRRVVCSVAPWLVFLAPFSATGAPSDTAACEWMKKRAAAAYARCRLTAEASMSRFADEAKYEDRLARCARKLVATFEKSERRYGPACPTTGDADDVRGFLDASADGVDAAIDGTDATPGTRFCGAGTHLDPATETCVGVSCGTGTVRNELTRRCEAELVSGPTDPGPRYTLAGTASRWVRRADMHRPRTLHAAAELDGRIYVVGGLDESGSSLEVYDIEDDAWTELPAMPTPRAGLAAVGAGGLLYAIGGHAPDYEHVATVERYDPASREWTRLANLPLPGAGLAAVEVAGLIHVIHPDGRLDAYDPGSNQWTPRAPMLSSNRSVGAGVHRGKIYAWGSSWPEPGRIEEYDPASDQWRALAESPPFHAAGGAVTMIGGVLLEFGGFNSVNLGYVSGTVQTYWVLRDRFGPGGGTMYAHADHGYPGDYGHAAVGVDVDGYYRIFVLGTGRFTEEYVMSTGLWRRDVDP